jgi:hypothetical protein
VFYNYCQSVACGKFLLDAWAVTASHGTKSLSCFYGKPYERKTRKRRNRFDTKGVSFRPMLMDADYVAAGSPVSIHRAFKTCPQVPELFARWNVCSYAYEESL